MIDKQQQTISFDERRCVYVINLWICMLEVAPSRFIQQTMKLKLSEDVSQIFQKFKKGKESFEDYYSLLMFTSIKLMECGLLGDGNTNLEEKTLRETIRTNSVMFIRMMLVNGKEFEKTLQFEISLVGIVLIHLQSAIKVHDDVFQVELLGLLYTILSHLDSKKDKTCISSPLFLPMLSQGLIEASKRKLLLNYWIDHIISFLPFLSTQLPKAVEMIIPQFCSIIKENALSGIDSLKSQMIKITLEGLRKILSFCVLNIEIQ